MVGGTQTIKGNGYRVMVAGQPLNDFFRGRAVEFAFMYGGKMFIIGYDSVAVFDATQFAEDVSDEKVMMNREDLIDMLKASRISRPPGHEIPETAYVAPSGGGGNKRR